MAILDAVRNRLLPANRTIADGSLISSGDGFGVGQRSAQETAREVVDRHRKAKARRRMRDLTAEKYQIWIDGEGNSQYAEIVDGQYVMVPFSLQDSLRLQRNLLRPMTDNMVAYHTAQQFRAVAESTMDKKSRDHARVDTLLANHIIVTQRLNDIAAESLYLGAAYGLGVIHAQWRDDPGADVFDPIYSQELPPELMQAMRPGMVDIWPGDPWGTTYNEGATRRSVQYLSYDRVIPTQMLREAFANVPGIDSLEGRTDLPSASRFQRTVRRWTASGGFGSYAGFNGGTAAIFGDSPQGEELSAVVCFEMAAGVDSRYPQGRLVITVIRGQADVDERNGGGSGGGSSLLLHDGRLPAGRFSCVRVYAGQRSDDVLGAPYVKDIGDLQAQLNHLVTLRAEFLVAYARPPFLAREDGLADDTIVTGDNQIIEYTTETPPPGFVYPPSTAMQSPYDSAINETLDQMFRIGGWQAASRGESKSGDAAAKVVALARADDTIFGPINRAFQSSICDLLQLCHALAKQYMTTPMLVELTGEDWGYLADPWIRQEQLSDKPPIYRLTNGFGGTPEARGQQLTQLVGMKGADGQPLLTTRQFWTLWPDQSIRPPEVSADRMREARAQAINYAIENVAEQVREQFGPQLQNPQLEQAAAQRLHQMLGQKYPLERSDNPQQHVEVLDQIVQNVFADPLAQLLARWRQGLYYDFMQQMAAAQAGQVQPQQPQQAGGRTATALRGGGNAGTPTSQAMAAAPNQVAQLTRAAEQGQVS